MSSVREQARNAYASAVKHHIERDESQILGPESLPGSSCFSSGMMLLNPVSLACSMVMTASLIEDDGEVDVEVVVEEGPTELSADSATV